MFHSGFSVETTNCFLVFDYYRGPVKLADKNIYVFSSHSHADHYNSGIFDWLVRKADINYILSSDIVPPPAYTFRRAEKNSPIKFMAPDEELQIGGIFVKTFNSTDQGVSFLVKCDGISIFHAGDFNWWAWPDDTKEEAEIAEKRFKEEIAKIKGERIDLAFFPVDPRLEDHYCLGAEYFIREIAPLYLIPMHFSVHFEAVKKFKKKMDGCPGKIIELTHRGQKIALP